MNFKTNNDLLLPIPGGNISSVKKNLQLWLLNRMVNRYLCLWTPYQLFLNAFHLL